MALAPCLLGYGAVASMLDAHKNTVRKGNTYWPWIQNYVADDYVQAVKTGSALLEEHAQKQSPSRIDELVRIFIHATKVRLSKVYSVHVMLTSQMEIGFWNMFPSQAHSLR